MLPNTNKYRYLVYSTARGQKFESYSTPTTHTYAITLSSLLIRPDRAPITSWEAIGKPRELRALTARWIWLMVESSLTAARRMSRVSLDTGIYGSINRKDALCILTMLQLCGLFTFRKNTLNNKWMVAAFSFTPGKVNREWHDKQRRTFPYLASWNGLTGFSSKEERVNACWVELGF